MVVQWPNGKKDEIAVTVEAGRLTEKGISDLQIAVDDLNGKALRPPTSESHEHELGAAISDAAGKLPNGWQLEIIVARNAGWAKLYNAEGVRIDYFDYTNSGLGLAGAIRKCVRLAQSPSAPIHEPTLDELDPFHDLDELDPFHDQGNGTNHRVSRCSLDYCGFPAIPSKKS